MKRSRNALIAIAVMLFACASVQPVFAEDKKRDLVKEVTDATFNKEVLKSEKPVLVDVWATWCKPCMLQGPIVDEVAIELDGKVKVVKVNFDENKKTVDTYKIEGIPALFVFKKGKVVEQLVGLRRKADLIATLNQHL